MNLHPDVLPSEQQDVLRQLGRVAGKLGYYLAGGTATAIHLGHRRSVDLDWFTEGRMDDPMRLATQIRDEGVGLEVRSVDRGTLHATVGTVRLSFFEFRYPLLKPLIDWPSFNCLLASIDDLAAMKLLAVEQRGAKKDFLDIYALGMHGLPLARMLELYRTKFSVADISRVAYSLCYFDDAEPNPMPTMLADIAWEEAKQAILTWVKSIAG
jgi:hypothetical protein